MTAEDKAKNAGKVALVLEGGSFRGQFTAGVLDVLMEAGVEIPAVYGVSAGALNGITRNTVFAICADLGIEAADVLALGDGRNDIEMLTWAGRGVALGDAPAEVREAADHVTDRFADDGTAKELLRWF